MSQAFVTPSRMMALFAFLGISASSSVHAQGAELIPCPAGAVETDITLEFRAGGTGSTCGPSRTSGVGGACDDGSYAYDVFRTSIWGNGSQSGDGFPFAFQRWPSFWVNINGNLSFGGPISTFTPSAIPGLERPAIAPYFGDVDLTNRSGMGTNPGRVLICEDQANRRIMFTWLTVGYYNARYPAGRLNSFQAILKDEGEVCVDPEIGTVRGLSIEYRYQYLDWYVGEASGSNVDGLCNVGTSVEEGGSCVPAVVGFDTGNSVNAFQVAGTRRRQVNEVLLAGESEGAIAPGIYRFFLLNGDALPSVCGDGVRDLCESCDDGELNGITCCRTDCSSAQVAEICGGGHGTCVVEDPDLVCECDEGYESDGVACVYAIPTAHAGPDQAVAHASAVTLDGSGSSDPRGAVLGYNWTQVGGPAVALVGANTAGPTFVAPGGVATLTFQLEVCNTDGYCATDAVVVTTVASPSANAGPDRSGTAGATVVLDGSGSSDPQGLALSYAWVQVAGPAVSLGGADTATPSYTAPTGPAVLIFQLEVCNTFGLCATDTVSATVVAGPAAHAGADQTVNPSTSVGLSGLGSSDPQGQVLSYVWTQIAGPAVALNGANTGSPSFTAPATGPTTLTFQVEVCNTSGLCATDTVVVTVRGAPSANAGPDQTVNPSTSVGLTGAGSTDPQGLPLTYAWTQTGGPAVALDGANTGSPSFTAPATGPATLTFQVEVCSDAGLCATDTVVVTVRGAPNANAGPDRTVNEGTSVSLSSAGSTDPQGETLTSSWTQTSGPAVELAGADTSSPSFTAPSGPATLTFTVEVCNTSGLCATDAVQVTVVGGPTADAGGDQTVNPNAVVTLGGTSSDPQGETLSYTWTQTGGPSVELVGEGATPTFTSPEGPATLTFQVVVCNASGLCANDTVVVTVIGRPTANAGVDQTANAGGEVGLSGAGSSDPQGQALSYTWTQVSGPTVALNGEGSDTGFTAPEGPATLTFQLEVCNTSGLCATDTVQVSIVGEPTASAGPDQDVAGFDPVELDASGSSDPQGETLTYTWTQTGGPEVELTDADTSNPSFTAPDGPATLTFEVTVCNASGLCALDEVTVTVGCRAGYQVVDGVCVDVDECAAEVCGANATCTNTEGGYTCECEDGYTGDGVTCTDIDECATATSNDCGANATCTNTEGGYTCECEDGYTGDGVTCTDIDECASAELNDCGANATCTNTAGGHTCACDEGYTGDGVTCTDIDECASAELNTCDPSATCTNTAGGHTCTCPDGYMGDGQSCVLDDALIASGAGGCAAGPSSWWVMALAGLALLGLRRRGLMTRA